MRWRGTQWLIEEYLRTCGSERHISTIKAYMLTMHQISPEATRMALWRLMRAGRVVETEQHRYTLEAV